MMRKNIVIILFILLYDIVMSTLNMLNESTESMF